MLQFSKRLVSKGLKVTLVSAFMNPNDLFQGPQAAAAAAADDEGEAGTSSLRVSVETIIPDEPEPEPEPVTDPPRDRVDAIIERFQKFLSPRLGEVIKKQRSPAVTCVVYDSVIPWALDVVKQLGLDLFAASFFTQSNAVNAIYYSVHQGLLTLPLPVEEPSVSLTGLPLPLLHISDLPSFVSDVGRSSAYPSMLGQVLRQFSNFTEADCIFFNTFDRLEGEVMRHSVLCTPSVPQPTCTFGMLFHMETRHLLYFIIIKTLSKFCF